MEANVLTVSGAYGRDYTSAAKAIEDWKEGKDFVIRSPLGFSGKYVSVREFDGDVLIRYHNDRKIVPVT